LTCRNSQANGNADQPIHISADKEWRYLKDCSVVLPVGSSNGLIWNHTTEHGQEELHRTVRRKLTQQWR
jgi:hypothetical protein